MDSNKYSVKVGIKLADNAIANVQKDLNEKLKNEKFEVSFSSKGLDDISKKLDEISTKLGNVSKSDGFNKTSSTAKKAAKEVDNLNNKMEKTGKHLKNQAFATDNWAYNWSKAMQSFLTYNTVTQFFNTVSNGIQDMILEVKELDDALTELKKVTDLEGDSLDKFVDKAFEAGREVAKTGTEMVGAATSFAKAGYDEKSILELGKVAAMYTNIADEEISAADSADFIIAQLKAFNLEAEDTNKTLENSYHIIDAVNEVSNNYAVSSSDIATNMGKASAVMANAGNSMEQMIGLMTAGTEITRSASKVANGLKTITLRLQGMDDDGEESLELQAQMEALFQKLGISVYNANGELKSTYEILETLAPVYQELTNAEKAYVTETIAGKYQAQNAAAILSNWKVAIDATTTALNSNGSATKENEKVLESIQGHLQKLSSAWGELSKNLFNSDFLKLIIDLGTALLNVANSGFGKMAIKITLAIVAFKLLQAAYTKTIIKIKAFNVELAESYLILKGYSPIVAKAAASNATLGTSFSIAGKMAISSLKSMGAAALKFMATPLGIATIAVGALAGAIYAHNKAIEEHIDRMKEMNEAYSENSKELQDDIDGYKKYKKILEDTSSTEEEKNEAKKELLEIQNQLAKKYDTEAEKLDLVNGKYEDQLKILKDIEKEKSKDYIENNYEDIEDAKKYLKSKIPHGIDTNKVAHANDYEKYPEYEQFLEDTVADGVTKTREEWISFYDEQIDKIKEMGASWGLTKDEIEQTVGVITASKNKIANDEQFKQSQETYQNYIEAEVQSGEKWSDTYYKIKEQQAKYAEAIANGDEEGANKALEELDKLQDKLKGQTFKTTDKDYKEQLEQYNYMVHMFDDYRDKIKQHNFIKDYFKADKNGGNSEYKKAVDGMIDGIKDELGKDKITTDDFFDSNGDALDEVTEVAEEYGFTVNELVDALIDLGDVTEGTNHIVSEFAGKTESWSKTVDELQTKYSTLKGIIDEYNETGYISVDSLQSLLEKGWSYLQYLDVENGKLSLNISALQAEASAKLDEAEATAYADAIRAISLLKQGDEKTINEYLATSYENLKTKIDNLHTSYGNLINDEATLASIRNAGGEDGVKAYENVQKELETKLKLINSARDNINKNFSGAMGYSGGSSSGSGSSSKSSKSEKEWWEKEYDALKNQFDYSEITIEQYIGGLENLLGRLGKGSEAWKKINKELQKQRLDKVKDDYDAGRISLDQYIISLQNLQQAYKAGTDAWNDLADAIKKAKLDKLKEQQDDLKSALSAVNDTLDKQVDKYEKAKDAADKKYEDEIDKLEELQDKLDDQNDDYERAQQAVADYLDEQMSAMEKQRDTVETYYDNVLDAIEKMNEKQQESLELAEAYEALMNAMTQKTKKVKYMLSIKIAQNGETPEKDNPVGKIYFKYIIMKGVELWLVVKDTLSKNLKINY